VKLGRYKFCKLPLTGETIFSRLRDLGEDKALRAQINAFLASNPLRLAPNRNEAFKQKALKELLEAQKKGLIPGLDTSGEAIAKQAAGFMRFATPGALLDAEWEAISQVSGVLRASGYTALAALLELRPNTNHTHPNLPPLMAMAMRFFFRREVEINKELFQGLVYDQIDQMGRTLDSGFQCLQETLNQHGDQLAQMMGDVETIRDNVTALIFEQARQGIQQAVQGRRLEIHGQRLDDIYHKLIGLHGKLDRPQGNLDSELNIIPAQSAERELIKVVKANIQSIPENQRSSYPALFSVFCKLELRTAVRYLRPQMYSLLPSLLSKSEEILRDDLRQGCQSRPGSN
jgi:hypothetical protein